MGSTITRVIKIIYMVFNMFGSMPTVSRIRLGFDVRNSSEICGRPLYKIYPISPRRIRHIIPADKYIKIFSKAHLTFLFVDILSCIGSLLILFYYKI